MKKRASKYAVLIAAASEALNAMMSRWRQVIVDVPIRKSHHMAVSPPFFVNDVLDAAAAMMIVTAGQKKLKLVIGLDPAVPLMLLGDVMHVQRALDKLIVNVMRCAEQGEISLLLELVQRKPHGAILRFVVSSTGPAIDASATQAFGAAGRGRGVRQFAMRLMGGVVSAASEKGKARIAMTMPFGLAEEAVDVADPDSYVLRILLIDGSPVSRNLLSRTIRSCQWQVESVASVDEAEQLLAAPRQAGSVWDVLLVDGELLSGTGLAHLQALQRALDKPGPVLLIMAGADERHSPSCQPMLAQADILVSRPVTPSVLVEALADAGRPGRAQVAGAASGMGEAVALPLEGARLLLVDDCAFQQSVAAAMLEQAGATVQTADNGLLAVELMAANPQGYDAVLMDIRMPVMDGWAATRHIRQQLGLQVPVLALSAGTGDAEQEQCRAAGMDAMIAKPIDQRQMHEVIACHLGRAAGHRADSGFTFGLAEAPGLPCALDLTLLLSLCRDQPSRRRLLLNLVRQVIEHIPIEMDAARKAWLQGRPLDAVALIHGARGALGPLGARRFGAKALELEALLRMRHGEGIGAAFDAVDAELAATVREALDWLSHQNDAPGVGLARRGGQSRKQS